MVEVVDGSTCECDLEDHPSDMEHLFLVQQHKQISLRRRRRLLWSAGISLLLLAAFAKQQPPFAPPAQTAPHSAPAPSPPPPQPSVPSFQLPSFNSRVISNPRAFRDYESAVAGCTWSPPEPLSQHTARYRAAPRMVLPYDYFGGIPGGVAWPALRILGPMQSTRDSPVSTCVVAASAESGGGSYHVTRVGPIVMEPAVTLLAHVVPAGPVCMHCHLRASPSTCISVISIAQALCLAQTLTLLTSHLTPA